MVTGSPGRFAFFRIVREVYFEVSEGPMAICHFRVSETLFRVAAIGSAVFRVFFQRHPHC